MNTLDRLMMLIQRNGGFINSHAHFDRAYTAQTSDFERDTVNAHLFDKWEYVNQFKSMASEERYYNHISEAIYNQVKMGVVAGLSFIDCDQVSQDRALNAALRAKEDWKDQFTLKIACQTLKGVLEPEPKRWFFDHAHKFDVIGGLPKKDLGQEGVHIDTLLEVAKANDQLVHVHVDQLNCESEKETELLARKVMEHGMEGKVTAVHSISLAAHPQSYRNEVYKMSLDADLSFVSCPTAWIDHRRSEKLSVTHNAITPIDEMVPLGLTVAIGSDNICDIYKPFSDGNMMTELRFLLEATHFYNIEDLVDIATTNGRKVIGL
jgi:cytosine/adenosine deaminase-related metal-dependent hydrolase